MKQCSQTHREAAMQKLLFPKTVKSIETRNVRTLSDTGKSAQVAREMDKYGVQVLGLSEVGWIASGKVTPASGHELLYSGQPSEDDNHRNGVGIMLTKKANRSLMKWEPINDRVLRARPESLNYPVLHANKHCRTRGERSVLQTIKECARENTK